MGHSSKSNNKRHSSKHSHQGSAYTSSSSKPSCSTRPTPLEMYLSSGEPHERVAVGWPGDRQSGQQMVQDFDSAWGQASSSSSNTYYTSSGGR